MANKVSTLLMYEGTAEAAMELYVAAIGRSRIVEVERYGPGEMGTEGKVKLARFQLAGRDYLCIDSPTEHAFTFTPSASLFVECESEAELLSAFDQLSAGGAVLMPLDNYGFSTRFAWVQDRFGLSWQLNLA